MIKRKPPAKKKVAVASGAVNNGGSRKQQRSNSRDQAHANDSADLPSPEPDAHQARKKQQMRRTPRWQRRRRQNHFFLTIASVLLLLGGVIGMALSSTAPAGQPRKSGQPRKPPQPSQVKRSQPSPPSQIDLEQENRLIAAGMALLKQNKYRQAEPLLRQAKKQLQAKRDICVKDSALYHKLDNMLEDVAQAHYQAQKNICLQQHE